MLGALAESTVSARYTAAGIGPAPGAPTLSCAKAIGYMRRAPAGGLPTSESGTTIRMTWLANVPVACPFALVVYCPESVFPDQYVTSPTESTAAFANHSCPLYDQSTK